uniref:Uncharacterized protein n=1 Tax=viral metagenome TaxID=1070528 RepID=A0A6M3KYN4_9ZZZZ
MKVKELIEKLSSCNQDARVAVYSKDGNHMPQVFVEDVIEENYEDLGTIVDLVI